MAFLSQDLFDVFEEKSEPVSLTGKKRRRAEDGKEPVDEQKRRKAGSSAVVADEGPSTPSQQPPSSCDGGPSDVVDLTADEEGDTKEETRWDPSLLMKRI